MSKKNGYLLGVLLTIIIGTLLSYFLCSNTQTPKKKETTITNKGKTTSPEYSGNFKLSDSLGDLNINIKESLKFKPSSFTIIRPVSKQIDNAIAQIVIYLEKNPKKLVTITGLYLDNESNSSAYPNLGIARATSVKNYFVSKGVLSKHINTLGKLSDKINFTEKEVYNNPLIFSVEIK